MDEKLNVLLKLDSGKYVHASSIVKQYQILSGCKAPDAKQVKQKEALDAILKAYCSYVQENIELSGYSEDVIKKRVDALNKYYDFIATNKWDNIFSAQTKFRPRIIEEFMYILFRDLIQEIVVKTNTDKLFSGHTNAYTNLYFSAKNLEELIHRPKIGINEKDQDFAIYRNLAISVEDGQKVTSSLPIVAIENKTFIDKTMLEGAVATADKVKAGNPYSFFCIVTEMYDVSLNVDPAYSRIDQIYVLRKCKRRDKVGYKAIQADVVVLLFDDVKKHLERNWCNLEHNLTTRGLII